MEEEKVDRFLNLLHKLDTTAEDQGLRAFVLNVEKRYNHDTETAGPYGRAAQT